MSNLGIALIGAAAALAVVVVYDLTQRRHAILRVFPVIGHLRFLLEALGPELRQYIVTDNDEERPFTRDERRWVYSSSKLVTNEFGFGTDNDLEVSPNYLIVKHAAFPLEGAPGAARLPCAKVLGAPHHRPKAFRMPSVVNISGMSFGALSGPAVAAMNLGAKLAECLHNTGEGGLTTHHRLGGDLVWQIGTGYFGCRDAFGRFDLARLVDTVATAPVRAVEIKLSQGAKPGLGGVLPGSKVTREIAALRGVEPGVACVSPARHAEFSDVDGLIEFVEHIAAATGLPVGIKSAVGEDAFWHELVARMRATGGGPDFVTVDGGEGGTGAGPLVFTDHVALPFKVGMARVYTAFARAGMHESVVFIGSGKLGFPEQALLAFGLGCDAVNVGREAMLAAGCIQAQRCHTGRCPTGVTTHSRWRSRGLVPEVKAPRVANYIATLRNELAAVSRACGRPHPALVTLDAIDILDDKLGSRAACDVFGYEPGWGLPSEADRLALRAVMGA